MRDPSFKAIVIIITSTAPVQFTLRGPGTNFIPIHGALDITTSVIRASGPGPPQIINPIPIPTVIPNHVHCPRAIVTTITTHRVPAATFIAAIVMIVISLRRFPPGARTSSGGCPPPRRGARVSNGVVVTNDGGGSGSGDGHEGAAAATTLPALSIAALALPPVMTIPLTPPLPASCSSWVIIIDISDIGDLTMGDSNPSLLLTSTVMVVSINGSNRGRGHPSEDPRRGRRCRVHSLPAPTVAQVRAARRGGGRPSAFVNATLTTAPPRPGPASLLSSTMQSQLDCIRHQGGRVGESLRAAAIAAAGGFIAACGCRRPSACTALAVASQESRDPCNGRMLTASRAVPW